jgi:ATP-dependent Clp protease ATP-binding subunit ClpA
MFERFTEDARQVVVLAQEEAREAHDPCIDGTHLLLGIATVQGPGRRALEAAGVDRDRLRTAIREVGDPSGEPIDAEALAALGIDLERVRQAAEAVFGAGALEDRSRRRRRRPSGHLPFTDVAKSALERSLRACVRLGDHALDTRHLLLGLLDVGEKRTTAVLQRLGVDPADLRNRLEQDSDAA